MNEAPNFEKYSYEALLQVYGKIDEIKYPERKARVAALLEERKDSNEAYQLVEKNNALRKYSTFFPRLFAGFIDAICLFGIAYALSVVLGVFPDWLLSVTQYITAFDIYIYSVVLHGLYGQTIGKALLSVKVVNVSDESDITFKQAFLRDCVPIGIWALTLIVLAVAPVDADGSIPGIVQQMLIFASVFHFIWFLIEVSTMLLNDKRRALHDYIADTVVINI